MLSNFGQKLKSFREHKRLSQQDMADKLKIPQSTYSRYERSDMEAPISVLSEVLEVFGTEAAMYFIGNSMGEAEALRKRLASASGEMPPGEAVQKASVILREIKAAAPHLREYWSDEDQDEFLGGVTQILTSVPRPEIAASLRQLLLSVAKVATKKVRQPPAGA